MSRRPIQCSSHARATGEQCRPRVARCHLVICLLLVAVIGGCARDRPALRVGALPFPGPFTLYSQADVNDLGEHAYGVNKRLYWIGESRGIVYTCRAGFLDLAHIRDTVDMAWYVHRELSNAVARGQTTAVVRGIDPSRHHITLNLTESWQADLGRPRREQTPELDAALIDTALRAAWIAMTWHEIITWYGYKSTGVFPEDRSAFTYDDVPSHAVGLEIARQVLEQRIEDVDHFNQFVTAELTRVLQDLDPVSPDDTDRAADLVEQVWWESARPKRMYLDIGMASGCITPWLVPDMDVCADDEPRVFNVPQLRDALRSDGRPLVRIEIEPRIWESRAIRASIPGEPDRILPYRDFPHMIEHIRRESAVTLGPSFDRPD